MEKDLSILLSNARPHRLTLYEIRYAQIRSLHLRLIASTGSFDEGSDVPTARPQTSEIICIHAVDFSIRPRDPNLLEGGPAIEIYENHPLLENNAKLQLDPGSDGERFDPPVDLKLLQLGDSYVIAERFEFSKYDPTTQR